MYISCNPHSSLGIVETPMALWIRRVGFSRLLQLAPVSWSEAVEPGPTKAVLLHIQPLRPKFSLLCELSLY